MARNTRHKVPAKISERYFTGLAFTRTSRLTFYKHGIVMRGAGRTEGLTAGGHKALRGPFVKNVVTLFSAGKSGALEALALGSGAIHGVANRPIRHPNFPVIGLGGAPSKEQEKQKKSQETSNQRGATVMFQHHGPLNPQILPVSQDTIAGVGWC